MGGSLSSYFNLLNVIKSKYIHYKILPMTRFEPWISGVGSASSTN